MLRHRPVPAARRGPRTDDGGRRSRRGRAAQPHLRGLRDLVSSCASVHATGERLGCTVRDSSWSCSSPSSTPWGASHTSPPVGGAVRPADPVGGTRVSRPEERGSRRTARRSVRAAGFSARLLPCGLQTPRHARRCWIPIWLGNATRVCNQEIKTIFQSIDDAVNRCAGLHG